MIQAKENYISEALSDHITLFELLEEKLDEIVGAAKLINKTFLLGKKVMIFGNGGSAADASHLAAEFIGKGWSAISLAADTAVITALANDIKYEDIFAHQLQALGNEGDLIIAISTSGASTNFVRGIVQAYRMGISVIVLTGARETGPEFKRQGNLEGPVDVIIEVPSRNTQRVQEAFLFIEHMLFEITA